jgi:hypothetical protein
MKKDWQHNNPETDKYISYRYFSQDFNFKDNKYILENLPPMGTIIYHRKINKGTFYEYEWYYTDKDGKEYIVNNSELYFKPYYEPDYEVISNDEVYYKPLEKTFKIKDFIDTSYIVGFEINEKSRLVIKTALDIDNEFVEKQKEYRRLKKEFKDWDN